MVENSDFPRAPNTFALPKSTIEDIVRTQITFGPITFCSVAIVAAFDEETANIVVAITAHHSIRKREVKLHPVTVAWLVIVETNPRPGGVTLVAHSDILPATSVNRQFSRFSTRQGSGWRGFGRLGRRLMSTFERQFGNSGFVEFSKVFVYHSVVLLFGGYRQGQTQALLFGQL